MRGGLWLIVGLLVSAGAAAFFLSNRSAGDFGAAPKEIPAQGLQTDLAWPGFRGPSGMGDSADAKVPVTWGPQQNIVWKTDLPGTGTSSPIIVGSRIYLTSYSGFNVPGQPGGDMQQLRRHLVCLDKADGKVLWSKTVDSLLPEQARIREEHGYASSTPVSDGQHLYAFFGKSGVVAFDLEGKQLWQAAVGSGLNGWGSAASPILHGDLVIVNASVESESLVALDKKTGKEVWRAGGVREAWNTPILVKNPDGKTEVVVAIMGKVLSFDPDKGAPLWSCRTDIAWYMVPGLVASEGNVYCIGGRTGGALAVRTGGKGDVTGSHRLWTGRKGSNVSSPILYNDHLYWMHEGLGVFYCAEAKTGNIVFEQRIDGCGQVYASPVRANDKLYFVARNGRTFVFAARPAFAQIAANDLGERGIFNASPAVADGRLYIRSNRYLYCIGS